MFSRLRHWRNQVIHTKRTFTSCWASTNVLHFFPKYPSSQTPQSIFKKTTVYMYVLFQNDNIWLWVGCEERWQCNDFLEVSSGSLTYFKDCGGLGKQELKVDANNALVHFHASPNSLTQRGFFIHFKGLCHSIFYDSNKYENISVKFQWILTSNQPSKLSDCKLVESTSDVISCLHICCFLHD